MNKHQVTHTDGTVSTRNSKTATYAFAVEIQHGLTEARNPGAWGVANWCGRIDLAQKAADKLRRDAGSRFEVIRVVPVETV